MNDFNTQAGRTGLPVLGLFGMASFITFEGIEGSGKTLQLKFAKEEFDRRGVPCVATLEPGGTRFGSELRRILLRLDDIGREPVAELLLYLADRCQHLKEVVEPHLERGVSVLSDRYHDATLAYQGFARGIGFEKVDRLARILDIRKPDLTVVLDLDVEVGLARARTRNDELKDSHWGRFEAEDIVFHQRVREGYHLLAKREPRRVQLVDASGPPEEVRSRVIGILDEHRVFARKSN